MPQPSNVPHEHTIRLRRPWQKRVGNVDRGFSDPVRIDVPEPDVDLACEPVVYQRRFNRPSALETLGRVRLDIDSWQGELIALRINDHAVDVGTHPAQFDISSILQAHNCIEISLAPIGSETPQLTGPVNLVIISPPELANN